jgi:hypothetical protein
MQSTIAACSFASAESAGPAAWAIEPEAIWAARNSTRANSRPNRAHGGDDPGERADITNVDNISAVPRKLGKSRSERADNAIGRAQRLAQRRLRATEPCCRPGKAALPRHGEEGRNAVDEPVSQQHHAAGSVSRLPPPCPAWPCPWMVIYRTPETSCALAYVAG